MNMVILFLAPDEAFNKLDLAIYSFCDTNENDVRIFTSKEEIVIYITLCDG
jgi:hypothetical protein